MSDELYLYLTPTSARGDAGSEAKRVSMNASNASPPNYPVADGFRLALAVAGIDWESVGVREDGPLNWTPADVPPDGPPEPPVAVARRRELTRQQRADLDARLRIARWFAEFGTAV